MVRRTYTAEQIINKLKEAEILRNLGAAFAVARGHTHTQLLVSMRGNGESQDYLASCDTEDFDARGGETTV